MPPPLVQYATEAEYREHYESRYCCAVIRTFDGIRVFFPKQQFDHAFFESANRKARDKSVFSRRRAERIDWISAALQDPAADLFVGWDRDKKKYDCHRRVTVVYGDYVVVLSVSRGRTSATFITAFIADGATIQKIRSGPRWQ
jgi:hypothetical protein